MTVKRVPERSHGLPWRTKEKRRVNETADERTEQNHSEPEDDATRNRSGQRASVAVEANSDFVVKRRGAEVSLQLRLRPKAVPSSNPEATADDEGESSHGCCHDMKSP